MNFNPMLFPTLILTLILYIWGIMQWRKHNNNLQRILLFIGGLLLAMPGAIFVLYYSHIFDNAVWFYNFRMIPYTELSAAGAGFITGIMYDLIGARRGRAKFVFGAFLLGVLYTGILIPYIKPIIRPLDWNEFKNMQRDNICIQSTEVTCSPCSAATLLHHFGFEATEKEIAQEAFSSRSGTESWYLARVFRIRGIPVKFIIGKRGRPKDIPYPSIASVVVKTERGRISHFIAIIDKTQNGYLIGDPLFGKLILVESKIFDKFTFTGFFIRVGK